jgi:hypothetical protein
LEADLEEEFPGADIVIEVLYFTDQGTSEDQTTYRVVFLLDNTTVIPEQQELEQVVASENYVGATVIPTDGDEDAPTTVIEAKESILLVYISIAVLVVLVVIVAAVLYKKMIKKTKTYAIPA